MAGVSKTRAALLKEIRRLRRRLAEPRQIMQALREGQVDAVVVSEPEGEHVYHLQRIEEALRSAEELNRCIVESSQDCIQILDPAGNLLSMNAHGQHILEIANIGLHLGKPWIDLWDGADRGEAQAALDVAREGGVGRFRSNRRTAAGSTTWWDMLVSPVPTPEGRAERLVVISRDITLFRESELTQQRQADALKQLVEELAAANEEQRVQNDEVLKFQGQLVQERCRFEELFDLAPDAYVLTDSRGIIREVNRAAGELLRIDAGRLPGQALFAYFRESDRATLLTEVGTISPSGPPSVWEVPLALPGPEVWVGLRISRTVGHPGTNESLRWVMRDITAARFAEEEKAEQSAQLERKARELARSNAELEQFASIISHDLRSPLLSINGCVELLAEQAGSRLTREDRDLIGMVRTSVKTMADLIKGLLDYARVDASGISIGPCDCDRLLQRVRNGLDKLIGEAAAELIGGGLPMVLADEKLLMHVFQNLVENAIKYRGAAPPHVEVTARRDECEWVFSVSDNGTGIEPQHFARIFQMFKRLPGEHAVEGSGIGLATAKKVVELHGGRIWVESKPGVGSTFYFSIPE